MLSATKAVRPNLGRAEEALSFIMEAGESAGYKAGSDFHLGLDAASSEFFKEGKYCMDGEGKTLDPAGMVDYLTGLAEAFPIVSIEDGCAEDDFAGWKLLTDRLGAKVQLVGDDVFVTNPARFAKGIEQGLGRSWSRSTRSAPCPRRWTRSIWPTATPTPP